MLGALVNPAWLVSEQQSIIDGNETIFYTPSEGVYTKCNKPVNHLDACTAIGVFGLSTDSQVFPAVWKAATVFLAMGESI